MNAQLVCAHAQPHLPPGGELPGDVRHFFSEFALWSRLPTSVEGTETLRSVSFDAAVDYFRVFAELAAEAGTQGAGSIIPGGARGSTDTAVIAARDLQRQYCEYRIERDPAVSGAVRCVSSVGRCGSCLL